MPPPISVAILEDADELRAGRVTLLSGFEGFTCVGAFSTGEEALRRIPDLCPDVVLMDINLSAFGGSVSDPTSIKIYKRSSSGIGSFVELPTTYNAGTNELVATITGFSEFILGGPAGTLAVEGAPEVPGRFALEQNYPNPFNPSTRVRYAVPARSFVSLTVCNVLGQEIATLASGEVGPGAHEAVFNASGLPSGVCFVRISARGMEPAGKEAGFTAVRKMLLTK